MNLKIVGLRIYLALKTFLSIIKLSYDYPNSEDKTQIILHFLIIAICLLITTAISFSLWRYEKNSQEDLLLLCKNGASSSLEMFQEYRILDEGSYYINAVADFNVFVKASFLLNDDTIQHRNSTFSNEVYGALVFSPEQAKKHIDEIIEIRTILSADINDPNGYVKLSNLRNTIKK